MLTSTRLTHFLKILSVSGIAVSISLLILFITAAISGTPDEGVYVAIWYVFFVGLPMYGIPYLTAAVLGAIIMPIVLGLVAVLRERE